MAVELPEALTLAGQMNEELKGKVIERAHLSDECGSLIRQGFMNLHEVSVAEKTIGSVTSQGKWIFVRLEPDMYLLLALETGGKVLYHPGEDSLPDKYHVRLDFADGSSLTVRILGWGFAKAVKEDEMASQSYPGKLGVSPVDDKEFTFQRFCNILERGGKKSIKQVLLDQRSIAGIGNGYAQDILFKARIHPQRKAVGVSENERIDLYYAIRETLNEAIRLGGREREHDLYDNPGGYRPILGAHMRGKPCPECGTAIEKLSVRGSSSYICPSCQKRF